MLIKNESELIGIKKISEVVAITLKKMCEYAQVGMSTKELDDYGAEILKSYGAKSAPFATYKFPGWTCISIDKEFCHGIPSEKRILREGELINIDVSAELGGYFSDNGCSFVVGQDVNNHQPLIDASKEILKLAINEIKAGVRIADVGELIEKEAKGRGYKVIKNLAGHGVGKRLHEPPHEILNYKNRLNFERFKKNSVVAIETFISTHSTIADTLGDGWTMVGNKGGYMTQHEHTIVVTEDAPMILTTGNGVWD